MSGKSSKTPSVGAQNNYVSADDVRTRLLDSMIERLENRSRIVDNMDLNISEYRAYCSWLFVGALLVVFCVLRYGVDTVDVHQIDKEGDEDRVIYRERQLGQTSEAFRQRRQRDK